MRRPAARATQPAPAPPRRKQPPAVEKLDRARRCGHLRQAWPKLNAAERAAALKEFPSLADLAGAAALKAYQESKKPPAAPALRIEGPKPAEVAAPIDRLQRKMVDEYGELDRRLQMQAPDAARYEILKKAIKSWFDGAPPDADGVIEGRVYRLHLSARERERRVLSMRDLVAVIGLEKFLELATVPIGALEDLLGKTRAAGLVAEARTGSRRIKAVPKRAAGRD